MTEQIDMTQHLSVPDVPEAKEFIETVWGPCAPRNDIADAVIYLLSLAKQCSVIVELGCECGHGSTRAFSAGLELNPSTNKCMVSVDIRDAIYPEIRPKAPWWSMIVGDSRSLNTLNRVREKLEGKPIELLFVDSEHTASQVCVELDLWLPLCRQDALIVFHDTNPHAPYPYPDYAKAVRDYASKHNYDMKDIISSGQGISIMQERM